ncbi:cell wall-binding repeat-containing protein [Alkalibacterium sp. MB6]|uniref:cell wall-binding repeat-containing protein n=1 Tax=Alkalibacterium sp. MB6 TaxID=2081965 RepID=UPI00137A641C|nr:cell wall-binding repeat-containing protein [Alkalibacterium sp. MB6]
MNFIIKKIKKSIVISMSVILLATPIGSSFSMVAFAEENTAIANEEQLNEGDGQQEDNLVEESDERHEEDVPKTFLQEEPDVEESSDDRSVLDEGEQNEVESLEQEVAPTVQEAEEVEIEETDETDDVIEEALFLEGLEDSYTDMERSFKEFLTTIEDLSNEAVRANINDFQLFIDDEYTVHSQLEVLVPDRLGAGQSDKLKAILLDIRVENQVRDMQARINPMNMITTSSVSTSSNRSNRRVERETVVDRVTGQNRMRVAENISRKGWTRSDRVVLANGYKFADALSGSPLAAHYNAPMLLVNGNSISPQTLNEITRLRAKEVIVLGGVNSVPEHIITTLRNRGLSVRRLAGQNRYDTSRIIAEELISLRGPSTAHLVNGEAYADAISISPVAGRYKQPILLTRSHTLHEDVQRVARVIKDWRIIGGDTSVSRQVENQLNAQTRNVRRLSGSNRYEVNKAVLNNWGINGKHVYVGSGDAFADVLTGSVLGARESSGILLLSNRDGHIESAKEYAKSKQLDRFTLLGGESTLAPKVMTAFKDLYLNPKALVYVDAGHGGSDAGPVYGGVSEKVLNLQIARQLRDQLVASGNYDVIMSRDTDRYLTLAQRTNEANARKVDIFVSIHHNAMGGTHAGSARGVETFIHHRVASGFGQETRRSQFRTSDPRIKDSLALADEIHPRVVRVANQFDRGVKGNNFHVLRESNMPAVLLEYGFMDHAGELSLVRTSSYQRNAAIATKQGIDAYFGF